MITWLRALRRSLSSKFSHMWRCDFHDTICGWEFLISVGCTEGFAWLRQARWVHEEDYCFRWWPRSFQGLQDAILDVYLVLWTIQKIENLHWMEYVLCQPGPQHLRFSCWSHETVWVSCLWHWSVFPLIFLDRSKQLKEITSTCPQFKILFRAFKTFRTLWLSNWPMKRFKHVTNCLLLLAAPHLSRNITILPTLVLVWSIASISRATASTRRSLWSKCYRKVCGFF